MKRSFLFLVFLMYLAEPGICHQTDAPERQTFQIGGIDYFGYAGIDLKQVEEHLPIHIGDPISFDSFDQKRSLIEHSIEEVTGKPTTDITAVCCEQRRRMHIYIGLPGTSSRQLHLNPAPKGDAHLDAEGLNLYRRDMAAIASAMARGAAGEDDSKGYALSDDPRTRSIDLEMRTYSVNRGDDLAKVLLGSSDVQERRASASLLGYAERSTRQIRSLTTATHDMDEEVRNNAIRALSVLASATNAKGMDVDPAPFIALLYSGKWTDRNKSSLLLMHLTQKGSRALLDELGREALPALIEGARWHDPGHADPFLFILGRIEGIQDGSLLKLVGAGDVSQIIQKAESLRISH